MPYGNHSSRRPFPTTRKRVVTQYVRADGAPGTQMQYVESCGSSKNPEIDELKIIERHELSCGCYPEKPVAGVCAVCAAENTNPNVCHKHHVICRECGASLCMKHSQESDVKDVRLCTRCHLKEENGAAIAAVLSWFKRLMKVVFFK